MNYVLSASNINLIIIFIIIKSMASKIFWNKRFANVTKGLKYFVFQLNIIINNSGQKYIMTKIYFSLENFWLQR